MDYEKKLRGWAKSFLALFDIRDYIIIGGLGMLFYGLYGYDPRLAYSVIGGITFTVALFAGVTNNKD